jgi:rubrerythrin
MNDVAEFLAYAIKLEEDAAARFSDLAESMKTYGNREVAEFFGKMAHFSRLHLAEARKRAGFHKLPDMKPEDYKWPGDESPEATSMEGYAVRNPGRRCVDLTRGLFLAVRT